MLLVIERYGIPVNTIETRSKHNHPFGHFGKIVNAIVSAATTQGSHGVPDLWRLRWLALAVRKRPT